MHIHSGERVVPCRCAIWAVPPSGSSKHHFQEAVVATGNVKWCNDAKGFEFLSQESGPDAFVHFSALRA
jgi:hypothetical protein